MIVIWARTLSYFWIFFCFRFFLFFSFVYEEKNSFKTLIFRKRFLMCISPNTKEKSVFCCLLICICVISNLDPQVKIPGQAKDPLELPFNLLVLSLQK